MNTNTNNLPDIESLQNFANELFKSLPNEFPKEFSLDPTAHPRAKAFAENLINGVNAASLPTNHYDSLIGESAIAPIATPTIPTNLLSGLQTPPSATGIGADSSFLASGQPIQRDYRTSNSFDNSSATSQTAAPSGAVQIPNSVAGSGASPSYLHQSQHFNIENPETSFPDANLPNSKPQLIGKSTSVPELSLPFAFEQDYLPNIEDALKHITIYEPKSSQIVGGNTDSFYFLNERPIVPNASLDNSSYYFIPKSANSSSLGGRQLGFDANLIKKDFPILNEKVNGKPLVWFDNAATTQKPQSVIDRVSYFYEHENSNIHRAAHELAARATDAYEAAREKVRVFLGAKSANEIIFVRGATEAINLVAQSWGDENLLAGDEIIVSNLEHHANIVPWKRLADKKGLKLKVIPVNDSGELLLDEYAKLLSPKTKLVAVTQVSNALGTVTPVQQLVAMAHSVGAKALVDGAQSVSHITVNVQAIDADWFVFSGHKVFGPTGIGVLYGKEDLLNETQPWQGGGNMIQDVTFEHIKYHNAPNRFEAGTGNIADAVGLGAAIDYVSKIGMEVIGQYEHYLLEYATGLIKQIPGVTLIGTAAHKASVLSFTLQGYSNDEVGRALNNEGIAVRTGHHCAQPILRRLGYETTVRPSLAFYNTCQDVDRFIDVLWQLKSKK